MAAQPTRVNREPAMPQEIEAKLRIPGPEPLRGRLRALGAQPRAPVFETNRILDTADGRLRAAGCGLRVRCCRPLPPAAAHDTESAWLTFKGPRAAGELKQREELETGVADAAMLLALFERLGYRSVILYEKRRETWHLRSCEVTLDELPQLGWFAEIEGPDAQAIAAVRAQLDLAATPLVRETYVELAARHGTPDAAGVRRLAFSVADCGHSA